MSLPNTPTSAFGYECALVAARGRRGLGPVAFLPTLPRGPLTDLGEFDE
jgi:hypothetical protein